MFAGKIDFIGCVVDQKHLSLSDHKYIHVGIKGNFVDHDIVVGDFINCSGIMLDVVALKNDVAYFKIPYFLLSRSNVADWKIGVYLNIEAPVKINGKIPFNVLYGSVDCIGKVFNIKNNSSGYVVSVVVMNKNLHAYFFVNRFIGVDGSSVAIESIDDLGNDIISFFVPNSIFFNTIFSKYNIGSFVNMELDYNLRSLIDYVRKF